MVHARSFSFTDDAINVAFPKRSAVDRKVSMSGAMTGPQPADPALLLFQLRRAQSHWYQELYQSDPTPFADPTSYHWQMCLDMREWGDSLPNTLPVDIRRMFDQELRYSYVYCIAPSARAPQITDYSRILIFEYSLTYLDTMHEIAHSALHSAFYTYHDALKVYFMANQFIAVLRDAENLLFSGQPISVPLARPGNAPPPPIPRRGMPGLPSEDNIERSLNCLERVPQTLQKFGERWEDALMLKISFESIAEGRTRAVKARRQMRDMAMEQHRQQQAQYQNAAQGLHHPPPPTMHMQSQPQQQPREMRWVGVDPAQMIRRGPPQ